jgi:hypothetical protein
MAKRRKGHQVIFAEAPDELADRLKVVAKGNDRTITAEVLRAIRQHVEREEAALGITPPSATTPPQAAEKVKRKSGGGEKPADVVRRSEAMPSSAADLPTDLPFTE